MLGSYIICAGKIHQTFLLFRRHALPLFGIISNDVMQLKIKRVARDDIIFIGQLKCGAYHAANSMDRAITLAILLKLAYPLLGIGYFDIPDALCSKWFTL